MDGFDPDDLVAEQIDYYRARAPEYDQWWLRVGKYAAGDELARSWEREKQEVLEALEAFSPRGSVLELAAGTGNYTRELARIATEVTAVDTSPEALAIARTKLADNRARVAFVEANLFEWIPPRRYDVVFFAFWLTHVPPARFEVFWQLVRRALVPNGRVFFIDNAMPLEAAAARLRDQAGLHASKITTPWSETDLEAGVSIRELNDGRRFRIVKQLWEVDELVSRLAELGWRAQARTTATAFLYGSAQPMS